VRKGDMIETRVGVGKIVSKVEEVHNG